MILPRKKSHLRIFQIAHAVPLLLGSLSFFGGTPLLSILTVTEEWYTSMGLFHFGIALGFWDTAQISWHEQRDQERSQKTEKISVPQNRNPARKKNPENFPPIPKDPSQIYLQLGITFCRTFVVLYGGFFAFVFWGHLLLYVIT